MVRRICERINTYSLSFSVCFSFPSVHQRDREVLTKRDISLHRQAKLSSSGRESNHFLLLLHLFLALPSYSKIWRFNLSLHAKRETSARILKLFGSVARKSDIFVKFVLNQVSRPSFSKRSFRGEWVCCALFHHQREKFAHFFGGESVFFRFLSSREICHLSHFRYTVCKHCVTYIFRLVKNQTNLHFLT